LHCQTPSDLTPKEEAGRINRFFHEKVIQKPFNVKELSGKIREILDKK
jgi:hypothetical protein